MKPDLGTQTQPSRLPAETKVPGFFQTSYQNVQNIYDRTPKSLGIKESKFQLTKRQSVFAIIEMTRMLELSDKDF